MGRRRSVPALELGQVGAVLPKSPRRSPEAPVLVEEIGELHLGVGRLARPSGVDGTGAFSRAHAAVCRTHAGGVLEVRAPGPLAPAAAPGLEEPGPEVQGRGEQASGGPSPQPPLLCWAHLEGEDEARPR